jgi:hypothetical protein
VCLSKIDSYFLSFIFYSRIIKDYRLKASQIYGLAGRKLAFDGRLADVEQLVSCIQRSGASETNSVCDDILVLCVQALAEKHDCADMEPLIKLMVDPGRKVSCGSSRLPYILPLPKILTLFNYSFLCLVVMFLIDFNLSN